MRKADNTPEFCRLVAVDSIGSHTQRREIVAEAEERAALARRFGLLYLDSLTAIMSLSRQSADIIRVSGHLVSDVTQSCVISLAPVPAHIEADFEVTYSAKASSERDVDLDPLGPDGPEPLSGGNIDLGEAAAQQLAIALDPYPRAPGAALAADFGAPNEPGGNEGPFAALAELKKRP